jgi:hypothetical protein
MLLFPHRRQVMAVFALLAFAIAGCSSKSNPASSTQAAATPPAAPAAPPVPATPAPAPDPGLTLPRGTRLEVRLNQTIDVVGTAVAVPAGSEATGEVLVAHKRGLFKGKSVMALTLTKLDVNGMEYHIDTSTLSRSKKGKGKRSAALIGGGAGMGMLIGGVATGGVGLLVGGLAGGGAGALGAAFTGNRDLTIPAESVVNFRLQDDLTLMPETTASNAH